MPTQTHSHVQYTVYNVPEHNTTITDRSSTVLTVYNHEYIYLCKPWTQTKLGMSLIGHACALFTSLICMICMQRHRNASQVGGAPLKKIYLINYS